MTERQAFTDSDLLLSVHEIRPVKAFCCFKPTIFFNVSGTAAAESSSSSESHLEANQKANSATDEKSSEARRGSNACFELHIGLLFP